MIDEIKNPLPSIQQFYVQKNKRKKQVTENKSWLQQEDVAFNRDPTLVQEFSEKTGLDYSTAESLLIAFFQEIKKQLMDGKCIYLSNFGKFYVALPGNSADGSYKLPGERTPIVPKFKLMINFRNRINNAYKKA